MAVLAFLYVIQKEGENIHVITVRGNPYSAGIDFSRQNLTSIDVEFWRLNSISAL